MKEKVAWIGTGVMGGPMATHLLNSGYPVSVYNRTFEKAKALEVVGAKACQTIHEALKGAKYVFTIVGYPQDVAALYEGQDGLIALADEGAVLIDMTTSSPLLAERLYTLGRQKGLSVLDAPVSGGDAGAKAGTLSIMVGGDEEAYNRVLPLFSCMGKNIAYMGKAGSGQHTKAANQIAVGGATVAMTEAIVYAMDAGLDPMQMLSVVGAGAGGSWQIQNMGPRVLKYDYAPGFFIKHFIKDLNIILEECKDNGTKLELTETVLRLYKEMQALGYEDDGTQALIKRYR